MERVATVHHRDRHDADGMVLAWTTSTSGDPWHHAPERFGNDPMVDVIRAILDVALDPDAGVDTHERLVRAAAGHGDQRRLQAVEEGKVLLEYQTLATAIWDRLRELGPIDEALSAVIRLNLVLRLATSAAMQGYHRSDRAPTPSWAVQLEAQIAECSTSMAKLFRHADDQPAPAHTNGRGPGVRGGHPSENGHASSALLGNVPDHLVDSLPEGTLANRAASPSQLD